MNNTKAQLVARKQKELQDEIKRVLRSTKDKHSASDSTDNSLPDTSVNLLRRHGVESYKIVKGDCAVFKVKDLDKWLNHYPTTSKDVPADLLSKEEIAKCILTDETEFTENNNILTDRELIIKIAKLENQIKSIKGNVVA